MARERSSDVDAIRDGEPSASILGLSLDSPFGRFRPSEPVTHRLIELAQRSGVRLFDSADSDYPARTEALMGRVSRFDPGTVWLVGRSPALLGLHSAQRPGSEGAAALGSKLQDSLKQIPARPDLAIWVQWNGLTSHPEWDRIAWETLADLETTGVLAGSCSRETTPHRSGTGLPPVPPSDELSLLDRRWDPTLRTPGVKAGFIARNPLASGLLDGSRWDRSLRDAGTFRPPTPLRGLQAEVGPVLDLGFLTSSGHRTLAQAALRYVASLPGVASILVPLPAPERLEELLEFGRTPRLTDEEEARITTVPEIAARGSSPSPYERIGPQPPRGSA